MTAVRYWQCLARDSRVIAPINKTDAVVTPFVLNGLARAGHVRGLLARTRWVHLRGADMKLQDRKALVTGSDSGIGQAIATLFAEEGADVAVIYHTDRAGADKTAEKIASFGRR